MPALVACLMALPSAAGAAISVPDPAAESVAAVREAAGDVAQAVQPPSSGADRPDSQADAHPVGDTIAPIAGAADAPVSPGAAAAVPQKPVEENARPGTSHIAATSSGDRMSRGRHAHGRGPDGATRFPSSERGAPAHRATPTASTALMAMHGPAPAVAEPAAPGPAPAGSAPGAASAGASGGLFFGGGFALLVASLLLAGPRLRRQLSELPVVCRPAAFHVVLERPG
jgi:hypothetical protein